MPKMMRIAQVLDTLNFGGAQKMQLFLAQSLCPLGIDVTVISLRDSPNSTMIADLEAAGAHVVIFPFPQLFSPGSFWRLVGYLRREKFDLIQTYLTYSNIVGTLAGRLSGTPVIASLRNAGYDKDRYPPRRAALERFMLRYGAHYVIANGHEVASFWRKKFGDLPIEILVNAVDLIPPLDAQERRELRIRLMGDPDQVLILSIGRLTQQKGFPDLLRAFQALNVSFPSAVLVIAGGGDLLESLLSQASDLQILDHLFLLGTRNDIPKLLGAADIYVNSSYWEGTPVSVLEAMAAGLPIVATSVGESPYLLDDGVGLLVPPGDSLALKEALLTLVNDSQKRVELGQAAQNQARNSYGRSAWKEKLLTHYAKITPKASSYLSRMGK